MPPEASVDETLRSARRSALWTRRSHDGGADRITASVLDLIPHRPPLLLVDGIVAVDLEQRAIEVRRRLDPADPVFEGHFPDHPVYPGVLQIEMMGQAGLVLCALEVPGATPIDARAVRIDHASFMAELRPGDDLRVLARIVDSDSFTATIVGQIRRDDKVCSVASMEVYLAA